MSTRRFEAILFAGGQASDAQRLGELGAKARAATVELIPAPDTSREGLAARVAELWRVGIGPAEVVGIGPVTAGVPGAVTWIAGGLETLAAVIDDQIARRLAGELPRVERDPAWTLAVDDDESERRRFHEGLFTLADGKLGMRGNLLITDPDDEPSALMAGRYTGHGPATQLLDGPAWNTVTLGSESGPPPVLSGGRVLNLRAGTLAHELTGEAAQLHALLLSSLARPGTTLLRAVGSGVHLADGDPLGAPAGADHEVGSEGERAWLRVTGTAGSILAARHSRIVTTPVAATQKGRFRLDRTTAYESEPAGESRLEPALTTVTAAGDLGFDALFAEHRRAWAQRWEEADIEIEGDTDMQRRVRLALFHMVSSVGEAHEAAVGARGLSGPGYHGHVFWDTDVYVVPFLAATHPASARAALEYRYRRLPVSRETARALGRAGARFAWESAASGVDLTPTSVPDATGGRSPVYSGVQEEHVVAGVAWAAANYIDWTGDEAFAGGPGLELLVQTARWWASRIERDQDGSAHIRGVMGPDEYHDGVDDDAYTNVMARWNLRRAAAVGAVEQAEHDDWLQLAEAMVDGYDPATGIYEQFAGWNALEPLVVADLLPQRPVAADQVLGHARVRAAQIVKQPDVLMLHYLIPDELAPGSLEANLTYYDPRTAHGSSLSVGVHAALMARAGHPDHALELLGLATRIDLDDIGGEAAQGVHLAAMGSVWRAIALGFVGMAPAGDALAIAPVLPAGWESLNLAVVFRGSRIRVRVKPGSVELSADLPVAILIPAAGRVTLGSRPQSFSI